jgi:hypothetical protein
MQVLITTPAVGLTIPNWLTQLAANLTTLVGAAAMVVALRGVYEAAKGR